MIFFRTVIFTGFIIENFQDSIYEIYSTNFNIRVFFPILKLTITNKKHEPTMINAPINSVVVKCSLKISHPESRLKTGTNDCSNDPVATFTYL